MKKKTKKQLTEFRGTEERIFYNHLATNKSFHRTLSCLQTYLCTINLIVPPNDCKHILCSFQRSTDLIKCWSRLSGNKRLPVLYGFYFIYYCKVPSMSQFKPCRRQTGKAKGIRNGQLATF